MQVGLKRAIVKNMKKQNNQHGPYDNNGETTITGLKQ